MARTSGQFRFKRHDRIGANAAEDDGAFLSPCFVDTGDLSVLVDLNDTRAIVRGRTGSGKTALLFQIHDHVQNTIEIDPESLSLNYIANSTIIRFFTDLGVNLDVFYKLLWRHVFAVEIFKARFQIGDETAKQNFLARFLEPSEQKRRRKKAVEYISRFGDTFWQDTEYRTKEITTKFEEQVKESIGGELKCAFGAANVGLNAGLNENVGLSEERKQEVITRCQEVVNSIQVQELGEILILANEVLEDPQKPYCIVIDRLDDPWVDDAIRYRLIRALIDTVRDFNKGVKHAKIIIGLRTDLLGRVFQSTRGPGFHEEKYRSLYLRINWSRNDLIKLLDRRIEKLVTDRYTSARVTHKELLSEGIISKDKRIHLEPIDYILQRTWNRPRDVIEFFNLCIQQAKDKPRLTKTMIAAAEGEYSRLRFRSLADEWGADYPHLADFASIMKKRPSSFRLGEITDNDISEFCLEFVAPRENEAGQLIEWASRTVDGKMHPKQFRVKVASTFYKIGFVGLKSEAFTETHWVDQGSPIMSSSDIDDNCIVSVHPGLCRHFGITPSRQSQPPHSSTTHPKNDSPTGLVPQPKGMGKTREAKGGKRASRRKR